MAMGSSPFDGSYSATSIAKISQGAAGTTSIVTGVANQIIYVMAICLTLDAAGTIKFTEVAGDITGAIPIALDGGFSIASVKPILWTSTAGEDLKITTATGKAQGWLTYFTA